MTFPLVTRRRYLAALERAEQQFAHCPNLDGAYWAPDPDTTNWQFQRMTDREKWIYRVAWDYSAEANRPLSELQQRVGYKRDTTMNELGCSCPPPPDARRTREGAE